MLAKGAMQMTPTSRVLREARRLVKRGWCQFALARDDRRRRCGLDAPRATRFCMIGAIGRASPGAARGKALDAVTRALHRDFRCWGTGAFNDAPGRTLAEVLEVFDRAIADAERVGE